jgi:hypothetical protein
MRPLRAVGIAGYGAYVPRLRVRTADISAAWRSAHAAAPAVAEKSVAGPDEDVEIGLPVEVTRRLQERGPQGRGYGRGARPPGGWPSYPASFTVMRTSWRTQRAGCLSSGTTICSGPWSAASAWPSRDQATSTVLSV